jgi:hypothetical protein
METRTVDLLTNDITVVRDGVQIASIDIPSGYVPISFTPHMEQHTVVTGEGLENGMIVLFADNIHRRNPETISPERSKPGPIDPYSLSAVRESSRWALVTNLEYEGNIVYFDAIYSDGTITPRRYNVSIRWAVLKDFQLTLVCPACGEVHDENDENDENDEITIPIVTFSIDDIFEYVGTALFGPREIVSDEDQQNTESAFDIEDTVNAAFERIRENGETMLMDVGSLHPSQYDKTMFNVHFNSIYSPTPEERANAISYSEKDAEMTRRLYEALKPPKKSRAWVEVEADDLWVGDFLPIGGKFFTITSIDKSETEDITITLIEKKGSKLKSVRLVVRPDQTFEVKRRYNRK